MADLLLQAPLKYEPKTTNRWVLRFPADIGIQTWALKSCGSPKIEFETADMDFINTTTYVNTHYKWKPMDITLRDFIAPSSTEGLMEWIRLHAESVTGRMGYTIGCAKTIELESLDPTGVVTESWRCENCIIVGEVDFGTFDYTTKEVRELKFTIQPQKCIHLFG